jgi:hypothetical protein
LDEAALLLLSPRTLGFIKKEGWLTPKEAETMTRKCRAKLPILIVELARLKYEF